MTLSTSARKAVHLGMKDFILSVAHRWRSTAIACQDSRGGNPFSSVFFDSNPIHFLPSGLGERRSGAPASCSLIFWTQEVPDVALRTPKEGKPDQRQLACDQQSLKPDTDAH